MAPLHPADVCVVSLLCLDWRSAPSGPDQLDSLGRLFSTTRATSHCWCTAFCSTSWQFATGWYGGGNRRRFERVAAGDHHPMGVLAVSDGEPVGWCACGPRARYTAGLARKTVDLRSRCIGGPARLPRTGLGQLQTHDGSFRIGLVLAVSGTASIFPPVQPAHQRCRTRAQLS